MGYTDLRGTTAALLLFITGGVNATTISLFEDSLGTLPSVQGKLFFAGLGGTQTVSANGVDLDTTPLGDPGQHGYSNSIAVDLDRTKGLNLDFQLHVSLEEHGSNGHRAGFSVIVITNDLQDVELGFWRDAGAGIGEVWAQEVGFTHAEGALYDTSSAETNYSLQILGSEYSLLADGVSLLSGALGNLSGVASTDVYGIRNYLFFGDNTTSARGQVTLGDISLTTAPVPLPPSVALMLAACVGLLFHGRRSGA